MSRYSGLDPYVDPQTGVLKNRFGIVDEAVLEATEADLAASRSRELAASPIKGNFDLEHLQAIHRYLFGDLYEWAGKLRTVDISKNDNLFAHHAYIQDAADALFRGLASEDWLRGLNQGEFCSRAAFYLGEMNAIHPFREGNGRTQREFISHLAVKNGFYIHWEKIETTELLSAFIDSFRGQLSRLEAILRENTTAMN